MAGWGSILNAVVFPEQNRGWALNAVWGIGFSTFVGGLLNLAGAVSCASIFAYLGAGLLALSVSAWRDRSAKQRCLRSLALLKSDPVIAVFVIIAVVLTAIHAVAWMTVSGFNPVDDCLAYLLFPIKMLQTGSLGLDPFNERRLVSGLGGSYFLNTFVLSALSIEHVHIMDVSIGYVLLTALMLNKCRECGAPSRMKAAAVSLVLVHSLAQIKLNLTSTVLPAAMLLAIFQEIWTRRSAFGPTWRDTLSLAIVAGGLCSLKSTFIPVCGCVLGICFLFQLWTSKNRMSLFFHAAGFIAAMAVVLLPWMIALHRSNGTYLFPLSGKGFHRSAFYDSPLAYFDSSTVRIFDLLSDALFDVRMLGLLLIAGLALRHDRLRPGGESSSPAAVGTRRIWTCVLSAGALLALIFGSVMFGGGMTARRYLFPLFLSVLAFLSILAAACSRESHTDADGALSPDTRRSSRIVAWGPPLLVLLVLGYFVRLDSPLIAYTWNQYKKQFAMGMHRDPSITPNKMQRVVAAQNSVPAGAVLLANIDEPFLLNFCRNTIYAVDWPGGSSLPPGMPIHRDGPALASYLLARNIHYIALSQRQIADAGRQNSDTRSSIPFQRIAGIHAASIHASLLDLLRSQKKLYDDGDLAVIELNPPL